MSGGQENYKKKKKSGFHHLHNEKKEKNYEKIYHMLKVVNLAFKS